MVVFFRSLTGLVGILIIFGASQWFFDPEGFSHIRGIENPVGEESVARLGSESAIFFALGSVILTAAISRKRAWFYVPVIFMGFVVSFRFIGLFLYDTDLEPVRMLAESLIALVMLVSASQISVD